MRLWFNPADGQLHLRGTQSRQTEAARPAGFDRARYAGNPADSGIRPAINAIPRTGQRRDHA
jgi:hypothetical protein